MSPFWETYCDNINTVLHTVYQTTTKHPRSALLRTIDYQLLFQWHLHLLVPLHSTHSFSHSLFLAHPSIVMFGIGSGLVGIIDPLRGVPLPSPIAIALSLKVTCSRYALLTMAECTTSAISLLLIVSCTDVSASSACGWSTSTAVLSSDNSAGWLRVSLARRVMLPSCTFIIATRGRRTRQLMTFRFPRLFVYIMLHGRSH